ncbi:MAG TPA: hypothetical protein ENJ95_22535 [Bacteroidetes bacterium]|nr:hypothetical protein [Bacteroidota bacterium]
MKGITGFTLVTIVIGIITNLLTTQVEEKFGVIPNEQGEIIIPSEIVDDREIVFIDFKFSLEKHKWYVRLGGIILLVFPWFFSPLKMIFGKAIENSALEAGFKIAILPGFMRQKALKNFENEWSKILIPTYIVYLLTYFGIVIFLAIKEDLAIPKYCLLSAERIFNFGLSFI